MKPSKWLFISLESSTQPWIIWTKDMRSHHRPGLCDVPSGDGLRSGGFPKWKTWVLHPEERLLISPKLTSTVEGRQGPFLPPAQEMAVSPSHWSPTDHIQFHSSTAYISSSEMLRGWSEVSDKYTLAEAQRQIIWGNLENEVTYQDLEDLQKPPREGNGSSLQYSFLENLMD